MVPCGRRRRSCGSRCGRSWSRRTWPQETQAAGSSGCSGSRRETCRCQVCAVDLVKRCLCGCGRFSHVDFCWFSMVLFQSESDFDGLQISVCCPNLRKNRLGELELNCFSRITDFTLYTELLMILFLLRMKFYN